MRSICFVVRNEDIEVDRELFFMFLGKNELKSRFLGSTNLDLDFLIIGSTFDDWKRRQVSKVSIALFKTKTTGVDNIHPIKKNRCVGFGFEALMFHMNQADNMSSTHACLSCGLGPFIFLSHCFFSLYTFVIELF